MDATGGLLPHDRLDDWLDELQRLATAADALPPEARAAVIAVVEAFGREDGHLPRPALAAKAELAPCPPRVVSGERVPTRADPLGVLPWRRRPPGEPAAETAA